MIRSSMGGRHLHHEISTPRLGCN